MLLKKASIFTPLNYTMRKSTFLPLFILIIFLQSHLLSQAAWENKVYKDGIETVQCHKVGFPLNPAFIQLASLDRILFSFDDLNIEQSNYYYSIVHCNSNWEESDLHLNDYMNGFNENELYNFEYSINTLQEFTHFSLELPNAEVELLVSGNYIIKVFEGLDHEKLVLSQRFLLYENEAKIKINVKASSVVADRDFRQEVDFNVNVGSLKVYNPYEEIKVIVLQNSRWDNAISGLQPKFIKGSQLVYDFEEKSSFDGGNEYRNFDIKDLTFQSPRIAKIIHDSSRVHILLHEDEKRTFKMYSTWEDLNGNYLIKNDRGFNSELESDYIWVHFRLAFDFPLHDAKLYIGGQFTNYQYTDRYELHYDFDSQEYRGKIYLKQGYFNYAYFYLPEGETAGQMDYIEGNHRQTSNDYTIVVYYQDPDKQYDRLVGINYAISNI